MFEASILICAMALSDGCMKFNDTRGPYLTYNECKIRTDEMGGEIEPFMPPEPDIRYRCRNTTEEPDGTQT